MARDAIAHEEEAPAGKVRMTFRVVLPRQVAEALAARAIREDKNIALPVTEILEAAVRSYMTRQCWMLAGVTMALVLAGCTMRDTVMMQHPQTNAIVQCAEGYRRLLDGNGYQSQKDCIADYQRRGYERAPVGEKK